MSLNFYTTDPNLYPELMIKQQDTNRSHQHVINQLSPYSIAFEKEEAILYRKYSPRITKSEIFLRTCIQTSLKLLVCIHLISVKTSVHIHIQ